METAKAPEERDAIARSVFVESAAYLLRETFEGTPEGQPVVFLDRGVGFFATLAKLSSDEASADLLGSTIAAQTEHAKFYLDRLCEFLEGRSERVNWEDSWLIETVDGDEWAALQASLSGSYEAALRSIAGARLIDERSVGMVFGMIAHTAYHLGAIRQMIKPLAAR